MNKPVLKKCLTFNLDNLEKDKSFLAILDSVEETTLSKNFNKNTCKCCGKVVIKFLEEHQIKCFQNKIDDLVIKLKLQEEDIKHQIRIKGLEYLIEYNNEKWNKLYKSIK